MISRILLMILALAIAGEAAAQADTIPKRSLWGWRDIALLEAFAIATVAVHPLDVKIAQRLQNPGVQANRRMRDAAIFVETVTDPGSFLIGFGLYGYGKLRDNQRAADLGLHGLEALFFGAQLGNLMKGFIGRARPYMNVDDPQNYEWMRGFREGSDYRAFPSGHTISAFAAAATVTSEMKRWYPRSQWIVGPIMYGGAAAVGWSRMYDNKHWASDVITGAAIGTFVGLKVVTWHHMNPGNLIDRTFLGPRVAVAPDGSPAVQLSFLPPF